MVEKILLIAWIMDCDLGPAVSEDVKIEYGSKWIVHTDE